MTDRDTSWASYYQATAGREPRPLFQQGMAALDAAGVQPGEAIEIGFGDGTESMALLARGWIVTAIDPTPEAATALRAQIPIGAPDRLTIVTAAAQDVELPAFDLLYAGYALPFIPGDAMAGFWPRVRTGVRPGGWLIFNVFGIRDSWVGNPAMTFLDRSQAEALVLGYDIVAFDEEDQDGTSFLGPKHWHVFNVIARAPR